MEYTTDETVILIDAAYLDREGGAFADFTSREIVHRPLPKSDIAAFLEAITLEIIEPKSTGHKIQVIWIFNKNKPTLEHWTPSCLTQELNNVAFQTEFGEFSLTSYHHEENLVTPEALYSEMMKILAASKNTRRVVLIGNINTWKSDDCIPLKEATDRTTYFVTMNSYDDRVIPFKHCQMGFPLLKALRIRADEV